MATIKDGVKIGLGLLLFKWLLGLVGIIFIGGFALCVMANEEIEKRKAAEAATHNPPKRKAKARKRRRQKATETSVVYARGCVIRGGPSTKHPKVGFAKANTRLPVIGRHGKWRHVEGGRNLYGWCGCKPKTR